MAGVRMRTQLLSSDNVHKSNDFNTTYKQSPFADVISATTSLSFPYENLRVLNIKLNIYD